MAAFAGVELASGLGRPRLARMNPHSAEAVDIASWFPVDERCNGFVIERGRWNHTKLNFVNGARLVQTAYGLGLDCNGTDRGAIGITNQSLTLQALGSFSNKYTLQIRFVQVAAPGAYGNYGNIGYDNAGNAPYVIIQLDAGSQSGQYLRGGWQSYSGHAYAEIDMTAGPLAVTPKLHILTLCCRSEGSGLRQAWINLDGVHVATANNDSSGPTDAPFFDATSQVGMGVYTTAGLGRNCGAVILDMRFYHRWFSEPELAEHFANPWGLWAR